MVALSPEVEKLGLVLPSRNGPHSGWPNLPQPCRSRARSSSRFQPIFSLGQPSASAIGRGMAITRGEAATLGTSGGTSLGRSALVVRCWSSVTQPDEAGDHTSGRGPSTDSFQPRASAAMAAPDALVVTLTCTQRPSTSSPRAAWSAAICLTSSAFSDDAARVRVTPSAPHAAGFPPFPPPPPPPAGESRVKRKRRPATSTTASTIAIRYGRGLRRCCWTTDPPRTNGLNRAGSAHSTLSRAPVKYRQGGRYAAEMGSPETASRGAGVACGPGAISRMHRGRRQRGPLKLVVVVVVVVVRL